MRLFMLAVLIALAAGSMSLYDQEGRRVDSLREKAGGSVEVFDQESRRTGWGRRNADGSIELFDMDGRRIGTITRDGRVIQMHGREGR